MGSGQDAFYVCQLWTIPQFRCSLPPLLIHALYGNSQWSGVSPDFNMTQYLSLSHTYTWRYILFTYTLIRELGWLVGKSAGLMIESM